ncbi:MAG: type II/IV secretion system protein [Candidatus Kerfeldbacteria bacterium]|nr:type II/IV secretion system protein [Candidatus Kerfeldbacteria bacterium]
MNQDITSKHERSIDDLIRQSHDGAPQVSSEEVEEKLKSKIHEIEAKRKEEATQEEAQRMGVGYINLKGFPIAPEALILIDEDVARSLQAVCFFKTDREFRLGAINPLDPEVQKKFDAIQEETQCHGDLYALSALSLDAALKLYAALPRPRTYVAGIEIKEEDLKKYQRDIKSFRELQEKIQHVSTSDLFTIIMATAIQSQASDVHIEAEQDDVKVRFRVDGVLYDAAMLQKKMWPKVINRVKLLAKLKINVSDIPQDGRFTIFMTNDFIDVRVSTVPSAYGESIVMRLLMSSSTGIGLDGMGLVGPAYDILIREMSRPNGMIITTGPTGSGKTTTLYAILKKLNSPESKIITLENPIEYRLKGVTQSQVQGGEQSGEKEDIRTLLKSGTTGRQQFTFATGLRAVLRQDPDIVMVGEIRDQETAEIAIQAALTGHLMLSTLHTNSAAGAIPRLLAMNVRPFLLAPALNLLIGQRLVRRIDPAHKEEYTPEAAQLELVHQVLESIPQEMRRNVDSQHLKFYRGIPTPENHETGFRGRIGIFEMLTMNPNIEQLILSGKVSEYALKEEGHKAGMLTMQQDGILKALQGITTIDEVFKVTK